MLTPGILFPRFSQLGCHVFKFNVAERSKVILETTYALKDRVVEVFEVKKLYKGPN